MTTPPFDPVTPEPAPSGPPRDAYPTFRPVTPEPDMAPVVQPPARRSSTGSSRALNVALALAVLVAVGGVSFGVGRFTAPATGGTAAVSGLNGSGTRGNGFPNASAGPNGFPGGSFDPNGGGRTGGLAGRGAFGALGGMVIEGTVDSVTADSVTIRTTNGTTVTVGVDASTTYHSAAPATASDVTAGTAVKLQVAGGFRAGGNGGGNGTGNGGTATLGTAGDITIVP